jgi:hypothetical protein
MLRNVTTPIFLQKKSLTHFYPTRLYQFGLLTERKVEGLPEFREEFLKENSYYQQELTNHVLPIQVTDDETDIFENCAVWDLVRS